MISENYYQNISLGNLQNTCFIDLPPEVLEQLQAYKKQILFRKGDILIKQGLPPASVMFVLSGLVREYIEGPLDKNRNLRILTSGNFIGLSGLFNDDISNYSAIAMKDTLVCVINRDYLSKLIRENSEFSFRLVKRYSELENSFFALLRTNLYKQMNGKMADALLYLSSEEFVKENIFEYLSRKDIAEFASITTENAIRILKSFEKEGIISLSSKHIKVINREQLQYISQIG